MSRRKSGILLHITSLPGEEGIGTLGAEAYKFVDFLNETDQKVWQILPIGPTGCAYSPYMAFSAFAGNPLLIDLKIIARLRLLADTDFFDKPKFSDKRVNFEEVKKWKYKIFRKAYENFKSCEEKKLKKNFFDFVKEHNWWLHDYALFMSAKKYFNNKKWTEWDEKLKFRNKNALKYYSEELKEEIDFNKFLQFLFFSQWFKLKRYANSKNVEILGDMPLYIAGDSADVWSNTDVFLLDKDLNPTFVGGVPPDYFSKTGQLWGNPVFNWERLKVRKFDWWLARLHFNIHLFDKVRIDHFRGLQSFWAVPAYEKNAVNGEWIPANGELLLKIFKEQVGELPLLAEDLGVITSEVRELRDKFKLHGMKVLQFAFGSDVSNQHLPHNYGTNFVAYTATHDNDTTSGWLKAVKGKEKRLVSLFLGKSRKAALRNSIEMIWSSVAQIAIMPMQDLLALDSKARMNRPGVTNGNWMWRFRWRQLKKKDRKFLRKLNGKYNR